MHTALCGHAVGAPLEYALTALDLGIDLITITCHIPMEWEAFGQAGIRMPLSDLDRYIALVEDTAEKAQAFGVEVLCGIEEEVSRIWDIWRAWMQPWPGIIGILFWVLCMRNVRVYLIWLKANQVKTDAGKIDCYFRHLIDGVQSGRYDSMSHPDVIRTYGVVDAFDPSEHESVIREFLQALVESDVCMEVNTSGLNKGDFEVHPDPLILDWAVETG